MRTDREGVECAFACLASFVCSYPPAHLRHCRRKIIEENRMRLCGNLFGQAHDLIFDCVCGMFSHTSCTVMCVLQAKSVVTTRHSMFA